MRVRVCVCLCVCVCVVPELPPLGVFFEIEMANHNSSLEALTREGGWGVRGGGGKTVFKSWRNYWGMKRPPVGRSQVCVYVKRPKLDFVEKMEIWAAFGNFFRRRNKFFKKFSKRTRKAAGMNSFCQLLIDM